MPAPPLGLDVVMLPLSVLPVMVAAAWLWMPPPVAALLPCTLLSRSVRVAELST